MSHSKHLLSSCLLLFGWFADDYRVVWKDILVAHADRYPTAQSPALRPCNRDISVEGKR
jgi:hypothetical protein